LNKKGWSKWPDQPVFACVRRVATGLISHRGHNMAGRATAETGQTVRATAVAVGFIKPELKHWGKHPIALSVFRVYSIALRY
jgi:hypothetical protein